MKKKILTLVSGIAVLAFFISMTDNTNNAKNHQHDLANCSCHETKNAAPAGQEAKVEYTCPMHAAVISDKPGKCPTCGMDLVKKEAAQISYTCPMHKDVASDKAGKCPKCGMNLEKNEMAQCTYCCPMHPEVTSDKAGKCPKCGMNLTEKKSGKKEEPKK